MVQWGLGGEFGAPEASWLADPTGAQATFAGDPRGLWQAGRAQQMTAAQLANPAWRNQIMTGYQPLFGSYALAGAPGTFADYLGGIPTGSTAGVPAGVGQYQTQIPAEDWETAVTASRLLGTPDQPVTVAQQNIQNLLQNENARRNALAMANAYMGGGIGYGAQARQAALGNMYDIYSARQAGEGKVAGTFLDWLNTRMRGPRTGESFQG